MKRGGFFALGSLMVAALVLGVAGAAVAAPRGKLVVGVAAEPTSFDPHRFTAFPVSEALPNVFDRLLWRTPAGEIVPHLAASYRLVSPTVWEFKLREGVKFTNGEPVDAHAVKYSLERIVDKKLKNQRAAYFVSLARVEAVDRYTARIHTKYPDVLLPQMLTGYGEIVPPKYYQSHDPGYLGRHPVGSGPYRLASWKKGEELVYEANPHHWKAGVPRIKTVIVRPIPEPTTRVAALLSGEVDLVDALPPSLAPRVKANPRLEVVAWETPRIAAVLMVIKEGAPWADARVRRALNYAVDKDSIIQNLLQGYAKKVAVLQAPASFGYNPELKPYPHDPARARKLLAEAGYPDGFSAELFVPVGRFLMGKEVAEAVAGHLAKVGVKVAVRTEEWGAMVRRIQGRWKPEAKPFLYFLLRMDLTLTAEGMYAGFISSGAAYSGLRDKGVDKLIDEARAVMGDAQRAQMYRNVNRLLHEKAPIIFMYQQFQVSGKSKRVDWQPRADGMFLALEAGLKE